MEIDDSTGQCQNAYHYWSNEKDSCQDDVKMDCSETSFERRESTVTQKTDQDGDHTSQSMAAVDYHSHTEGSQLGTTPLHLACKYGYLEVVETACS